MSVFEPDDMVMVRWVDSTMWAPWATYEEILAYDMEPNRTIGFIVEQTPEYVKLVQSAAPSAAQGTFLIPTGCMISITTLVEDKVQKIKKHHAKLGKAKAAKPAKR